MQSEKEVINFFSHLHLFAALARCITLPNYRLIVESFVTVYEPCRERHRWKISLFDGQWSSRPQDDGLSNSGRASMTLLVGCQNCDKVKR
ncbi:hypothetical protein AVEN_100605-1 [Araneus ventricosus]|uniref:Uncharacterized protein n=1 Tax=Araneus ventricosus TaxID=182803 RepID=A0A4Y2RE48_ARAVE|nr:hypothetical protein AVEN_207539-1 [Araneus ventricosus]GBN74094.1 hypothetical protein AVEN_100605-1 [Araneus ventricosus]